MGVKDSNFQMVRHGEPLIIFKPGGIVFFQRAREHGGKWWLGYTHPDGFEFILDHPVSIHEGMVFLVNRNSVPLPSPDDFRLE